MLMYICVRFAIRSWASFNYNEKKRMDFFGLISGILSCFSSFCLVWVLVAVSTFGFRDFRLLAPSVCMFGLMYVESLLFGLHSPILKHLKTVVTPEEAHAYLQGLNTEPMNLVCVASGSTSWVGRHGSATGEYRKVTDLRSLGVSYQSLAVLLEPPLPEGVVWVRVSAVPTYSSEAVQAGVEQTCAPLLSELKAQAPPPSRGETAEWKTKVRCLFDQKRFCMFAIIPPTRQGWISRMSFIIASLLGVGTFYLLLAALFAGPRLYDLELKKEITLHNA